MPIEITPSSSDPALAAYDSPIGCLTLAARGGALVGLWVTGQRFFGSPYGIDEASARSALDLTSPDSREVVLAPAEWDEADAHALDAAVAWLDGYFAGEAPSPASVPLAPEGTDFQRRVWEAMDAISYGATRTYGHLTATLRDAGVPASAQAIGGAVGRNPLLLIRPCHRVVAADGPGGYAAGGDVKAWLLAHEDANELATQVLLAQDGGALAQPADREDDEEGDAQPPDDRIHAADQLLEAHEGGRVAHRDHADEDDAHAGGLPAREAARRRVEQRKDRVVDERENDERIDEGEGRVDRTRDLEGGNVHVPDAIHVQVQAQGVRADDEGDDGAADAPGAAGLADAQHRAAEHKGHRDAVDDAQREVVDCGEPQVGQRRGDLGGGGVELGDAGVRRRQRVDGEDRDGDDDHGRKDADHLHDPVEVEEGREDHEHRAQGATRPRGQAELLLEVRTGAREHHEAHREAREDEHDVDDAAQRRVGDAFEDLVVM